MDWLSMLFGFVGAAVAFATEARLPRTMKKGLRFAISLIVAVIAAVVLALIIKALR